QHVAFDRRLLGEDITGIKTEPQMFDIGAVPTDIPPNALGLPFAAHAFERLNLGDVFLAWVAVRKIGLQLQ
ncbi:MAG TPA: hypothetical protein EYQ18_20455, partial [Candidatus Handelsmanbacteria bacterium]|nr:hypothetical protein [Candidatus Handelsmanbacteria bacterium]